jgi:hypothetical protein
MRERGLDPLYCDRIDGCAGDIAAACAIPDPTAQRIHAVADVLGDLENRLHVIRAAIDGGIHREDQFGDLGTLPAANANSPAALKPVAVEAELVQAETVEAETVQAEMVQAESIEAVTISADIAAFASDPLAEIEPPVSGIDAEITAPTGAETVAAPTSPVEELDLHFDDQPAAAGAAGTLASPRLSHLLMAAELDRLLDAQAAAGTSPSDQPVPEPLAVTAEPTPSIAATTSVEAIAPDQAVAPAEVAPPEAALPVEATAPVAETTPVAEARPVTEAAPVEVTAADQAIAPVEAMPPQAASCEMQSPSSETAVAPAPLAPEPAAPPPRRVAEIPKDAFADVMALSEAERIALFS